MIFYNSLCLHVWLLNFVCTKVWPQNMFCCLPPAIKKAVQADCQANVNDKQAGKGRIRGARHAGGAAAAGPAAGGVWPAGAAEGQHAAAGAAGH